MISNISKKIVISCVLLTPFFCLAEINNEVNKVIESLYASNSWRTLYYDVVPKIVLDCNYKTVLEVGVAFGGHARAILSNTTVDYYGVDPYEANYDCDDLFSVDIGHCTRLSSQENFDSLYSWVKNIQLDQFKNRSRLIRLHSDRAAQQFKDNSIDCIFIDGDHRYASVLNDCKLWYPIVKNGGMLLGDDYYIEDVANAVNDFCNENRINLCFFTSVTGYKIWAIRK